MGILKLAFCFKEAFQKGCTLFFDRHRTTGARGLLIRHQLSLASLGIGERLFGRFCQFLKKGI
jgi:hypothetical protein